MIVCGVDGYPKGWVAVVLRDGRFDRALAAHELRTIIDELPEALIVGVDIPIGTPDDRPRLADGLARAYVGPRRNSVFMALPRDSLTASDIESARRACIERLGVSFSSQAWALREKILEVDDVAHHEVRIHEVHPEVSFRTMAGVPLVDPKSSWDGFVLRRRLLHEVGVDLPDDLQSAGVAGVDDVLDAAAAAWSANRIASGTALSFPLEPLLGLDGHRAAIWH